MERNKQKTILKMIFIILILTGVVVSGCLFYLGYTSLSSYILSILPILIGLTGVIVQMRKKEEQKPKDIESNQGINISGNQNNFERAKLAGRDIIDTYHHYPQIPPPSEESNTGIDISGSNNNFKGAIIAGKNVRIQQLKNGK